MLGFSHSRLWKKRIGNMQMSSRSCVLISEKWGDRSVLYWWVMHWTTKLNDFLSIIDTLCLQLQSMMKENEEVDDIEKLAHHEFDLDMEEQSRLQAEGDAEVLRVIKIPLSFSYISILLSIVASTEFFLRFGRRRSLKILPRCTWLSWSNVNAGMRWKWRGGASWLLTRSWRLPTSPWRPGQELS